MKTPALRMLAVVLLLADTAAHASPLLHVRSSPLRPRRRLPCHIGHLKDGWVNGSNYLNDAIFLANTTEAATDAQVDACDQAIEAKYGCRHLGDGRRDTTDAQRTAGIKCVCETPGAIPFMEKCLPPGVPAPRTLCKEAGFEVAQEGGKTAGWVLPLTIAASTGFVLALVWWCLGVKHRRRRQQADGKNPAGDAAPEVGAGPSPVVAGKAQPDAPIVMVANVV